MFTSQRSSPVGELTLLASDAGLRAVLWPGHPERLVRVPHDTAHAPDHPVLAAAAAQLGEWFAGHRSAFDLPLELLGTPFQIAVWERIAAIPFGTTTTYGTIAVDLGQDVGAAQAVGAATGCNPVSIVVPCHRVVGADGSLTGFAGGMATKRWLLDHESPQTSLF